jgi:hypothetical protein
LTAVLFAPPALSVALTVMDIVPAAPPFRGVILAVQVLVPVLVIVADQEARPGWRMTSRGVLPSFSAVTTVTLSVFPRVAAAAEVVTLKASARTEVASEADWVPFVADTTIR